jgi:hypothetical protein
MLQGQPDGDRGRQDQCSTFRDNRPLENRVVVKGETSEPNVQEDPWI